MPVYDGSLYDPPAPVAHVVLRHPTTGTSISNVHLLVDTGADVTLIPSEAASRLGVNQLPGVQYEIAGFDGTKSYTGAVELDLIFLRKMVRGKYLLTAEPRGILGRDILAHFAIMLDGPRQEWSERMQNEWR